MEPIKLQVDTLPNSSAQTDPDLQLRSDQTLQLRSANSSRTFGRKSPIDISSEICNSPPNRRITRSLSTSSSVENLSLSAVTDRLNINQTEQPMWNSGPSNTESADVETESETDTNNSTATDSNDIKDKSNDMVIDLSDETNPIEQEPPRRKRGRPKGSKRKPPPPPKIIPQQSLEKYFQKLAPIKAKIQSAPIPFAVPAPIADINASGAPSTNTKITPLPTAISFNRKPSGPPSSPKANLPLRSLTSQNSTNYNMMMKRKRGRPPRTAQVFVPPLSSFRHAIRPFVPTVAPSMISRGPLSPNSPTMEQFLLQRKRQPPEPEDGVVRRKRGRPPKPKPLNPEPKRKPGRPAKPKPLEEIPKRKPGRPRKNPDLSNVDVQQQHSVVIRTNNDAMIGGLTTEISSGWPSPIEKMSPKNFGFLDNSANFAGTKTNESDFSKEHPLQMLLRATTTVESNNTPSPAAENNASSSGQDNPK